VKSNLPLPPRILPDLELSVIKIYLNGELREVPESLTLAALLEWLQLPADRVAVERNREIASRSTWAETIIEAGDHLEVVHFVGGGANPQPKADGPRPTGKP
jgi:thiamine biosynthesis protein ThiS